MSCPHHFARIAALTLALPLGLSAAGCATFSTNSKDAQSAAVMSDTGKVTVEIRPHDKQPKVMQMPLSGDTYVQDAVDQSRTVKRLRRVHVEIRRMTDNGQRIKLQCQWDLKTKRIKPESDYALQPGDHVVISEDTSTMVDDMFKQVTGPLKFLSR